MAEEQEKYLSISIPTGEAMRMAHEAIRDKQARVYINLFKNDKKTEDKHPDYQNFQIKAVLYKKDKKEKPKEEKVGDNV